MHGDLEAKCRGFSSEWVDSIFVHIRSAMQAGGVNKMIIINYSFDACQNFPGFAFRHVIPLS